MRRSITLAFGMIYIFSLSPKLLETEKGQLVDFPAQIYAGPVHKYTSYILAYAFL